MVSMILEPRLRNNTSKVSSASTEPPSGASLRHRQIGHTIGQSARPSRYWILDQYELVNLSILIRSSNESSVMNFDELQHQGSKVVKIEDCSTVPASLISPR